MAFPSRPLHFVSLILTWGLLVVTAAVAVTPENRALLPAGGATTSPGRTPAEAGLESGRYREISSDELKDWERLQDQRRNEDSRDSASGPEKPASANSAE